MASIIPIVRYSESATVAYSGGVNTFTFPASNAAISNGDMMLVAIARHASSGALPIPTGWTLVSDEDMTYSWGSATLVSGNFARIAVLWRTRASGDSNYVFNTLAMPSLDGRARGFMLSIGNVKPSIIAHNVIGEYAQIEMLDPSPITVGRGDTFVAYSANDLLAVFTAVNTVYLNAATDSAYRSTKMRITSTTQPTSINSAANSCLLCGAAVQSGAGTDVGATMDINRLGAADADAFSLYVTVAIVLRPRKSNGLFGAATV